mmetsp:Transcript_7619/g.21109  ORF Transcript_7619/g.21109 Transcript_7619/m.21109 type:complete len:268 (+) Transcript_7619:762-1565(+)
MEKCSHPKRLAPTENAHCKRKISLLQGSMTAKQKRDTPYMLAESTLSFARTFRTLCSSLCIARASSDTASAALIIGDASDAVVLVVVSESAEDMLTVGAGPASDVVPLMLLAGPTDDVVTVGAGLVARPADDEMAVVAGPANDGTTVAAGPGDVVPLVVAAGPADDAVTVDAVLVVVADCMMSCPQPTKVPLHSVTDGPMTHPIGWQKTPTSRSGAVTPLTRTQGSPRQPGLSSKCLQHSSSATVGHPPSAGRRPPQQLAVALASTR